MKLSEVEARLVQSEGQAKLLAAHVQELQNNGSKEQSDAQALKNQLALAEKRMAVLEGERDATQRLLAVSDSIEGVDERVSSLSVALEACRREARELKVAFDRLEAENTQLKKVSALPSEASSTRILHMKPSARADHHAPEAVASKTADAVAVTSSSTSSAGDSETDRLRSQRLKEVFQRQIQLFKDAVYVLMGFKFDMTPDAKPQIRVKSMFAESPNDFLLFRYDPESSSVEMLQTEFTKTLDKDSLAFLTKCDSPPAFLASLSLQLFERQTFRL